MRIDQNISRERPAAEVTIEQRLAAVSQRRVLRAHPVGPELENVVREGEGIALLGGGVGEDEVTRPAARRGEDRIVTDGHIVGALVDQDHLRVGRTGVIIQALGHIVLYGDSLGRTARMAAVNWSKSSPWPGS